MNHTHLLYSARHAFVAATLIVALMLFSFLTLEPTVGRAITDDFTVSQQITNEISFLVGAGNVSMVGSIAGLTGGYATGTTYAVINTNNTTGYTMTLHFATTTRGHAMVASSTSSTSPYISNYTPGTPGTPDFAWVDNLSGQSAEFGYTVRASSSNEVDPSFRNNGTNCNAGSSETDDRCWMNPTTTPETIINSAAANSGSTTTIKFRVAVPSNPNPALPSGFYYATGTLTAVTNP